MNREPRLLSSVFPSGHILNRKPPSELPPYCWPSEDCRKRIGLSVRTLQGGCLHLSPLLKYLYARGSEYSGEINFFPSMYKLNNMATSRIHICCLISDPVPTVRIDSASFIRVLFTAGPYVSKLTKLKTFTGLLIIN
jgi:hypothetical protein